MTNELEEMMNVNLVSLNCNLSSMTLLLAITQDFLILIITEVEYIGWVGLTKTKNGSGTRSIEIKAFDKGDHFELNGSKTFATNDPIQKLLSSCTK